MPHFIIIWKDIQEDKIYITKSLQRNKSSIEFLFDFPAFSGRKILYLFRIKTVKHGSVHIPYMQ
jgi:hypothetical protein